MNIQEVSARPYFWATCLGCNTKIGSINEIVMADLDGSPFRSYYCTDCADTLTPERACLLAAQADEMRRANG